MPKISELQARKEAAIKTAVADMRKDRKLSIQYIIETVAENFFLKTNTVERIYWGEYDRRRERDALRKSGGAPAVAASV